MNVELENTLCDSKVLALAGFHIDTDQDEREAVEMVGEYDEDPITEGFDDIADLPEGEDPYAVDARFEGLQVAEFDG